MRKLGIQGVLFPSTLIKGIQPLDLILMLAMLLSLQFYRP